MPPRKRDLQRAFRLLVSAAFAWTAGACQPGDYSDIPDLQPELAQPLRFGDVATPDPDIDFVGTDVPALEILASCADAKTPARFENGGQIPPGTVGSQLYVICGQSMLCGELSLVAIFNAMCPDCCNPNEATRAIVRWYGISPPVAGQAPEGTNTADVQKFIREINAPFQAYNGLPASSGGLPTNMPTVETATLRPEATLPITALTPALAAGSLLMVPVWINGGNGELGGTAPHWMVISGVSEAEGKVRVYDPFNNVTREYDWEEFRQNLITTDSSMQILEVKKFQCP